MGFQSAGCWNCGDTGLHFDIIPDLAVKSNVLYAFVAGEDGLYIGKSVRTRRQRMQNYKTPGGTQWTNINNKRRLQEEIGKGRKIAILVLPDNGLLQYGGFHVNMAADDLTRQLQPPWNGGLKEDATPASAE
jgi:6-phosphofructokinase